MSKLPPPDVMYRALANRDPAYDGIFYVAVKTTRIFCRSVCHARTPKRENVEFYARTHDALYAGYRPCLRCRPLETRGKPAPMVEKLLAAVEADPSGRLREVDLARMGIDPSTARRQFQRYCGMSFHAYHRARRMGMALTGVREGKSMIDLQLDQGFESSSGFREAFAKVFGTAPSLAHDVDCLYAKWFETPLGPMLALANDAGLYLLEFVDRRGLEREVQALRRRLTQRVVPGEHHHLKRIGEELDAYFAGRSLTFATPLQLTGSPFQRAVWETLRAIPPGETLAYADVAAKIGRPAAVRAVGRANGDNKLTLIVPCHRVIGADGTLTGYGGGLWRKAWLLEHERAFARARGQLALVPAQPAAAAA
jgi:AraC family transcriptional regulator, regulatory protein of adaptative response / methylated-DNA-[protein]-cysteine methyltransferase